MEAFMPMLRAAAGALLLASMLAGCSLYGYEYRRWEKANASNEELGRDLAACGTESRVGATEGSPDPNTYFVGPVTTEQTQANRLFQRCMSARGWWAQQPRL
jgi:hypothetical protein